MLLLGSLSLSGQRIDRSFASGSMTPFIEKGAWITGGNVSYSTHRNADYKFAVLDNINSTGYKMEISPFVAYAFGNNEAAGARLGYERSLLKIHGADVAIKDLDIGIEEYYRLKHTISCNAVYRYYIPLDRSNRFAIFNEMRIGLGWGQAKLFNGLGEKLTGVYERNIDLTVAMAPGMVAFATDNIAIEVNVGILGVQYANTRSVESQVYVGQRNETLLNFKINLLALELGAAYYF